MAVLEKAHFAYHDALGKVRLCNYDRAQTTHNDNDCCVFTGRRECSTHVSHSRVETLDVELVLERNGQSVKGTYWFPLAPEILVKLASAADSVLEEDLRQTVGLRCETLSLL